MRYEDGKGNLLHVLNPQAVCVAKFSLAFSKDPGAVKTLRALIEENRRFWAAARATFKS